MGNRIFWLLPTVSLYSDVIEFSFNLNCDLSPLSRYGMVVHSALLTHWGALARDKSPDAQRAALLILKKLLQIDSKVIQKYNRLVPM